eukprot:PRCOL_00000225-RA
MTSLRSSGGAVGLAGAVQSADLVVHSLFIVNKSGGLVYHRDFGACARGILDTNETLRLGSIFHSLHAISTQLSPVEGCTGMRALRANNFALHCLQAHTGTKFFLLASPGASDAALAAVVRCVYERYADLVLKNPFYELEMPIRVELFEEAMAKLMANPAVAQTPR